MFCSKCGQENNDESKFCRICGTAIHTADGPKAALGCYHHEGTTAVGTCINCGKGICDDCCIELEGKFYCKPCTNEVLTKSKGSGTVYIVFSAISALLSIFFFPIVFGPLGIVLGYLCFRRNRKAGLICMVFAAVCMIVGFVLGVLAAVSTSS